MRRRYTSVPARRARMRVGAWRSAVYGAAEVAVANARQPGSGISDQSANRTCWHVVGVGKETARQCWAAEAASLLGSLLVCKLHDGIKVWSRNVVLPNFSLKGKTDLDPPPSGPARPGDGAAARLGGFAVKESDPSLSQGVGHDHSTRVTHTS